MFGIQMVHQVMWLPFEYQTPIVSGIWVSGIQMVTKYGSALSQSLKFNYFLQVTQVEIYKPREAKYKEFWVDFNEGTRYNGEMNDEHFNTEVVQYADASTYSGSTYLRTKVWITDQLDIWMQFSYRPFENPNEVSDPNMWLVKYLDPQ